MGLLLDAGLFSSLFPLLFFFVFFFNLSLSSESGRTLPDPPPPFLFQQPFFTINSSHSFTIWPTFTTSFSFYSLLPPFTAPSSNAFYKWSLIKGRLSFYFHFIFTPLLFFLCSFNHHFPNLSTTITHFSSNSISQFSHFSPISTINFRFALSKFPNCGIIFYHCFNDLGAKRDQN